MIPNRRFWLPALAVIAPLLGATGCGPGSSSPTKIEITTETKEKPPGPKFHPIEPGGK